MSRSTGDIVGPESIPALLESRAKQFGERAALVGNDGTGNYAPLAYRELLDLSRAVGDRLAATITESGETRVAWAYGNSNALVAFVLYHAVCGIGATNIPVNPASTPAEVADLVARAGVDVVVAPRVLADARPRVLKCCASTPFRSCAHSPNRTRSPHSEPAYGQAACRSCFSRQGRRAGRKG